MEITMTNIAFFSGDITRSGGTERVGTMIANTLEKEPEYQVFFVSLVHQNTESAYAIAETIPQEALSEKWIEPGPGYFRIIWKLIAWLRRNHITVLITIDTVLDVLAVPAKWFTGIKIISWEHFHYHANAGGCYRKWIRKLTNRYADKIVTLTEQDAAFYRQKQKDPARVCTIRNPADYMKPKKASSVRQYAQKIILSAGRLEEQKGFLLVPEIAAKIRNKYPGLSFQWLIAGEGKQKKAIETEIQKNGVGDYVRLCGQVQDISDLYDKALLYVMTSVYEGLPMVLLEARMYRLPSISFDILTGPSEIIQDGKNGYLIPYGDTGLMAEKIGELLTQEDLYWQFVSALPGDLTSYFLENIRQEWISLLQEIQNL